MSVELRPYGAKISVVEPTEQEVGAGLYLPLGTSSVARGIVVAVGDLPDIEGVSIEVGQAVWYRKGCGHEILRRVGRGTERVTILEAGCIVAVED